MAGHGGVRYPTSGQRLTTPWRDPGALGAAPAAGPSVSIFLRGSRGSPEGVDVRNCGMSRECGIVWENLVGNLGKPGY